MERIIEFQQTVARAINYTTWMVPRIRDGDRWRNIRNVESVENVYRVNGHDKYENAVFGIADIMKSHGWKIVISESTDPCHEHLEYHHYHLYCRK